MSNNDLKNLHCKVEAVRAVNAANEPFDCDLTWHRDGAGWVLLCKRRRMGRVLPDNQHRGMFRSELSRGRLSDISNLSWAKNAVLLAAERELEFEDRRRRAIDPPKCWEKRGHFTASAPSVRFSANGGPR
jgi:hypothetical protein